MVHILANRNTLIIICFAFILSGCGLAYFTDTRLLSGEIRTPTGNYPITASESWHRFVSSFKGSEVSIVPFNTSFHMYSGKNVGTLDFKLPGGAKKYASFEPVTAFYQINEEPKVTIQLVCNMLSTSNNANAGIHCYYPLPRILVLASHNQAAEGLLPRSKRVIKSSIKDTYRFVMTFQHNEGPLTIDLLFKLKLKPRLYFGVPGGSP